MNQNFDFSNSKHSLDNKSKVIDNQGANIENQNFHIHLAINKKAFTIFPDFRIKSTTHLCFMGLFEKNRHYNLGY